MKKVNKLTVLYRGRRVPLNPGNARKKQVFE